MSEACGKRESWAWIVQPRTGSACLAFIVLSGSIPHLPSLLGDLRPPVEDFEAFWYLIEVCIYSFSSYYASHLCYSTEKSFVSLAYS